MHHTILSKKNILIISPEPWGYINVSKHHYARELARRGHRVYFSNPPDADAFSNLSVTNVEGEPGISIVNYSNRLKGYRFFPAFFRIWLDKRFLKQLEKIIDERIDVIWNFENSRFYEMRFAGDRLKIYHQVDLNQNFHVRKAASQSDICFCTSKYIQQKISPWNAKVFKIHHGTQPDVFCDEIEFRQNTVITATYIGNIDSEYIDLDLLKRLIEQFPQICFKLVGSYNKNNNAYRLLSRYSNVVFVGLVSSSNIKYYLNESDILFVCYKADQMREQLSSPHKFMEYLASGKTIIATYTDEYNDTRDLLVMSKSNNEYIDLFKNVIANIHAYNTPYLAQKRKMFAAENTYEKQVDKINEKLKATGIPYFF